MQCELKDWIYTKSVKFIQRVFVVKKYLENKYLNFFQNLFW